MARASADSGEGTTAALSFRTTDLRILVVSRVWLAQVVCADRLSSAGAYKVSVWLHAFVKIRSRACVASRITKSPLHCVHKTGK